jgi:formylglycine-generating enzyme required for sulfatase activity
VQREFDGVLPSAPPAAAAATVPAGETLPPPSPTEAPIAKGDRSAHCNAGLTGRESYSLNCVTYVQARRYCEWRGGRLPTRFEWEQAASPEHPLPGVEDLLGGLSEWTVEPAAGGAEATRDRAVVLGSGLDTGAGVAGGLRRLYMSANAQGRSVGFRCVVQVGAPPGSAVATVRDPAQAPAR